MCKEPDFGQLASFAYIPYLKLCVHTSKTPLNHHYFVWLRVPAPNKETLHIVNCEVDFIADFHNLGGLSDPQHP